ncbi:type III-A CRISPR-associated RAMP protein Csm3 [Oribacterium parvum]|uniref:type III-A CRISPR-associated RAMP protein Csm3 n=1 Tax=Oribacterium parvum TaxID=1501329 RepID=UPI0028DC785B|nr:type III-A CRISPR-associated RAMP protein Csm3 [Oribacterium parvum]
MYGKILIEGKLEVVTGLHIGGASSFAAIGAVDSPVVRNSRDNQPMIPGSSLKGKMRSLLARQRNQKISGNMDEDEEGILRLFGSAKNGNVRVGRLIFSDLFLAEQDSLESPVEVKFENSINRLTAVANPRQLERVIPGTQFNLKLLYELKDTTDREKEKRSEYYQGSEEEWILKDFQSLIDGMKLLELDYLGGSGTRGYGQVRFCNLSAGLVYGDEALEKYADQLNDQLIALEEENES